MNGDGSAFLAGLVTGIMITALICSAILTEHWRGECISHGVAKYNSTTGNWEWSVPLVKESKELP